MSERLRAGMTIPNTYNPFDEVERARRKIPCGMLLVVDDHRPFGTWCCRVQISHILEAHKKQKISVEKMKKK